MDSSVRTAWVGLARLAFILALLLFVPAWSLDFWQAWVFGVLFLGWTIFTTAYLIRYDRSLLKKRLSAGPQAEKEKAQKIIQSLASLFSTLLIVLPGFDHRLHWSEVSLPLVLGAELVFVGGYALAFLALRENSFASGTIEIQAEQRIIESGPYTVIRHPMYAGAILMFVAAPLALGSWWSLPAAIPIVIVICARLMQEEKLLLCDLPEYEEYCRRTRFRLIPFVW